MPGLKKDREDALTIAFLHDCFELCAETGELVWRVRPTDHFPSVRGWKNFNTQFAGKLAGTLANDGYTRIWLNGRQLLAHRIVFAMANGRWPNDEVDHRDTDRANTAPTNLREAGPKLNSRNRGAQKNNTSGAKGVTWAAHANKWRAKIKVSGKDLYLGYFSELEAAKSAYRDAALKHYGDFARSE